MNRVKTIITLIITFVSTSLLYASEYPLRNAAECTVRNGLPNFFQKLERGESVNIAYLGGSITQQDGWRPKTLQWFREQFPQAKISEIHAAIGGTGSDLGVFRLKQDVLDHSPDLLFVEFAVNDGGVEPDRIHQTMEGIVRKTIRNDPTTDICFVYTLVGAWTQTLRDGKFPRAASAMEAIADHYGIPSIHMGLRVAILEGEGKLIFKSAKPKTEEEKKALEGKILFSPDNVHPYTDTGHELYLQAVARGMNQIRKIGKPGPHTLPNPFTEKNWENANMLPLSKAELSSGWRKLDPETNAIAKRFQNRMPAMYYTNQPGESIRFQFKGTCVRIYDILGPDCGQVNVKIDQNPIVVKPRFDSYCTYHRLGSFTIAENLPDTIHTVELSLHPDQPDKAAILATRNNKMDNPERYDDTAWYVGAILIFGRYHPHGKMNKNCWNYEYEEIVW